MKDVLAPTTRRTAEVLDDVVGLVVQRTGLVDVAAASPASTASNRSSAAVAPRWPATPSRSARQRSMRLCRGHRPEEGEESERRGGAHGVQPVACTLGMDDRALEVGRRVLVALHGDVAHEPQPGGQPFVVIERLELGDQRLDRRLERGDVGVGRGVPHGDAQLRDPRPRGGAAVARGPRESHRLAGGSGRAQQLALVLAARRPARPGSRRALGVGRQGQRALQQSRGGRRLLAGGRATSRAPKARRRAGRQAGVAASPAPSSRRRSDSALEVVAEQFVDGGEARPVLLEPVGEALVQHGARVLRYPVVRRVADELVTKAEGAFPGAGRPDEVHADESEQMRIDAGAHLVADERFDSLARELLALDGCRLDHRALAVIETVEPRREQRLDRRGHGDGQVAVGRVEEPLVRQHGDDLLDVERVALGDVEDLSRGALAEARRAQEVPQQVGGLRLGQRLQEDRGSVRFAAAPPRPSVEELGAGHDEQQQGRRRATGRRRAR